MGYLLFCITTALAALVILFVPMMNSLKEANPLHNMIQYKWITYGTFVVISMLVSPLIFIASIVPSAGKAFRDSLLETCLQDS